MKAYLLRRLLLAIPTLLGVTLVTFGISRLAPGGPVASRVAQLEAQGRQLTGDQQDALRELLGLDESLAMQYLRWLGRAVQLDFGDSFASDHRPVRDKVGEAFRVSLLLQGLSLLLIYLIAVPLGVWSAVRQGRLGERLLTLFLFLLYSLPSFFLAGVLLLLFSSGRFLEWFPMRGLASLDAADRGLQGFAALRDLVWHLVLPVACLTYAGLASLSRYARSGMLEVLRQDYVRAARARGLSERRVLLKHALRNGVVPLATLVSYLFPYLLGGSVIVETIFGIPGMGQLTVAAVLQRDYPVVMAVSTLVGVATLVGFLVSDVLYRLLDPRVTFE